jgi:chemotaxis protein CheY-P-specific phosphatase CheC
MISKGSKVINIKTNKLHVVEEIEIINGETLIFTTDISCFPIDFCREVFEERISIGNSEYQNKEPEVLDLLQSLHKIIDISEFPSIPYVHEEKNLITKIWDKIRFPFLQ